MNLDQTSIRQGVTYEFKNDSLATEAARNIRPVTGNAALSNQTCQRLFDHFQIGNESIKDVQWSGQKNSVNNGFL